MAAADGTRQPTAAKTLEDEGGNPGAHRKSRGEFAVAKGREAHDEGGDGKGGIGGRPGMMGHGANQHINAGADRHTQAIENQERQVEGALQRYCGG
jgi:hypothetical protein